MYCLNIHCGETWPQTLKNIQGYALAVKHKVSPHNNFALGLRLSALAAQELLEEIPAFKKFMKENGLYVVSINGFPYGQFHGTVIKQNVYLPDWSSAKRVNYTLDLAKILAELLPEGEYGTISSVPVHYGKHAKPKCIENILSVARFLAQLKARTGKPIVLCLEPEPDCYLDSLDSTLRFFKKLQALEPQAKAHIGVCLDCCHASLEFETPEKWLSTLEANAIPVPKIQLAAALKLNFSAGKEKLLRNYDEGEYMHQTRVKTEAGIIKFKDLPGNTPPNCFRCIEFTSNF